MFKELLKNKNLTQVELAEKIGKSQRLISYWVNGRCQPQLEMVDKLAEVLNCTVEDIIKCFK